MEELHANLLELLTTLQTSVKSCDAKDLKFGTVFAWFINRKDHKDLKFGGVVNTRDRKDLKFGAVFA